MNLTEQEIKDYIWSLNIRNYNKIEIYGLMRDYYGFKNIKKIEIFRYGESFDIHLRYGGIDVFWDEQCKLLDTTNRTKRRYKFRQQIYKDIQKLQINSISPKANLINLMKNIELIRERLIKEQKAKDKIDKLLNN